MKTSQRLTAFTVAMVLSFLTAGCAEISPPAPSAPDETAGPTISQRQTMILDAMRTEPPDLGMAREALADVGNLFMRFDKGPLGQVPDQKELPPGVSVETIRDGPKVQNYLRYREGFSRIDRGPVPKVWLESLSWGRKDDFVLKFVSLKLALTPEVRRQRDQLLTEADAKIRKGLLAIAEKYPAMRRTSRVPLEVQLRGSCKAQVNVCADCNGGCKLPTEPNVPPENRFYVFVWIHHPPPDSFGHWDSSQPIEDKDQAVNMFLPEYDNLDLSGQVHYEAADPKLDKAIRKLIDDALTPLKALNPRAAANMGTPY